jgi:hypothetical protein
VINAAVGSKDSIIRMGVPITHVRANYGVSNINVVHESFSRTISLRMEDYARDRNILPRIVKIDVENSTFNAFRGCFGLFDRSVIFLIEANQASQVRQIIGLVQASKGAMCLKVFRNVDRAKHSPQDEGYWACSPHIIVSFSSSDKVHLDPNTMFETFEEFGALLPFDIHD